MAAYSPAPYVSAAVAASGTNNSTIYTCPANSYAILNVTANGGFIYISIGGQLSYLPSLDMKQIYVGPSQAVVADTTSTGNTLHISGVQFTNSN